MCISPEFFLFGLSILLSNGKAINRSRGGLEPYNLAPLSNTLANQKGGVAGLRPYDFVPLSNNNVRRRHGAGV